MLFYFGVLEFIVVCTFIQSLFFLTKGNKSVKEKVILNPIEIESWKKILFLIFCFFSILYTLYSIVKVMNGSFRDISSAVRAYDNITKFSNKVVTLPKLMTYSKSAVSVAGYWFAYVVINNYISNKKIDILSASIVLVSVISSMTTGGRGGAVNLILGCVSIFFILMNKKSGFYKSIQFKTLLKFIIIGIIILSSFQIIGTALLGRTASSSKSINAMSFFDYLAVYCGAEIKNLDLFLQENYINRNIWGSQTFIYIIRWLGPKFGLENTYYQLYLPFRRINGFALGNVYTTFYPYIYDFGYTGCVVLIGLMAFIVEFIYERCKRVKLTNKPAICIIIYGYMFSSLVLSFFSNKFYEQNFNKQFVMLLIFCWLYQVFFCKVKLGKNKNGDYRDEKNKRI